MARGGGWFEADDDDVRKKAMHAIRQGICSKVGWKVMDEIRGGYAIALT
jgi:hypothetical protein